MLAPREGGGTSVGPFRQQRLLLSPRCRRRPLPERDALRGRASNGRPGIDPDTGEPLEYGPTQRRRRTAPGLWDRQPGCPNIRSVPAFAAALQRAHRSRLRRRRGRMPAGHRPGPRADDARLVRRLLFRRGRCGRDDVGDRPVLRRTGRQPELRLPAAFQRACDGRRPRLHDDRGRQPACARRRDAGDGVERRSSPP